MPKLKELVAAVVLAAAALAWGAPAEHFGGLQGTAAVWGFWAQWHPFGGVLGIWQPQADAFGGVAAVDPDDPEFQCPVDGGVRPVPRYLWFETNATFVNGSLVMALGRVYYFKVWFWREQPELFRLWMWAKGRAFMYVGGYWLNMGALVYMCPTSFWSWPVPEAHFGVAQYDPNAQGPMYGWAMFYVKPAATTKALCIRLTNQKGEVVPPLKYNVTLVLRPDDKPVDAS